MTTSHVLRTVHTADLTPAELKTLRALLDDVFDGDFADEDFEHCLGGLHTIAYEEGGRPVAHGAVVMRRVRHGGRWLRVGYVEGVGVRADLRRAGLGGRVMAELERVVAQAYDAGMLSASDEGAALYASRGWQVWSGRICALGTEGVVRLPDEEGTTFVLPGLAGPLDVEQERDLVFDWRDGDVL